MNADAVLQEGSWSTRDSSPELQRWCLVAIVAVGLMLAALTWRGTFDRVLGVCIVSSLVVMLAPGGIAFRTWQANRELVRGALQ